MALSHALARMDHTAALAETERIAAVRAEFRAIAEIFDGLIAECGALADLAPLAEEPGDDADLAYLTCWELASFADDMKRLALKISHRPRL